MKIGIDARLWNQTGVGRYIRNLISELQIIDKKNDYVLFVRDEDYKDVKLRISPPKADLVQRNHQLSGSKPMAENFKIVVTDILWHGLEEQLKFPGILNKYDFDVVHFPYYSVPVFYNKPFVVTIHDLIPLHFQTGKASTLLFPFYKIKFLAFKFVVSNVAKNAKKIIAPSNFSKEDIVKSLKINSSKIEVVYEGVDKALVNNVKPEEIGNYFLYIGNAYPHKNLEFLLNVFKNLPLDFRLILVGSEDYFYKRLKQKVKKLHLEKKIEFFGNASDSELSSLYRKAKALIIPSFIEGFGLPALEAMANGCLVIASDIPALHEVGGNAAVYFDLRDEESLKEIVKKVYSNTLMYQSKVELGFERTKEFSWKKTAGETLKIYESSSSASFHSDESSERAE